MPKRNPDDRTRVGTAAQSSQSTEATGQGAGGDMASERGTAENLADAARDRVHTAFQGQRQMAAERLGGVASALHQAAEELDGRNQGVVAHYADLVAERVDRLADTLRERDLDQILSDVESYVRRQPEVFVGGAMVLGFIMARLVRASAARRGAGGDERQRYYGHGADYGYGAAAGGEAGGDIADTEAIAAGRPATAGSPEFGPGPTDRTGTGLGGIGGTGSTAGTATGMGAHPPRTGGQTETQR